MPTVTTISSSCHTLGTK